MDANCIKEAGRYRGYGVVGELAVDTPCAHYYWSRRRTVLDERKWDDTQHLVSLANWRRVPAVCAGSRLGRGLYRQRELPREYGGR